MITREQLLKQLGYRVTSVRGNEAAQRSLALNLRYDLFIIGHDAPREIREVMVRWLKDRFPDAAIIALNPPIRTNLRMLILISFLMGRRSG
jgi:hypothetical protein